MTTIVQSVVPEKHFRTISILIVSNTLYCNKLKESLIAAHRNVHINDYKLSIIKANYIEDMANIKLPIDFIVFIVDTSITVNIEQLQQELKKIDKSFFMGKICIVNATNFIQNNNSKDLVICSKDYKIPLINGDMSKPNKCNLIGERILRLLQANLLMDVPFVPWICSN